MLHTQTVDDSILELLRSLQQKKYLNDFFLVGGTALALYYGHRKSIDLDLFTNQSFDASWLLEQLQQDFPIQLHFTSTNTIKGSINNIKVDLIAHRYQYLEEPFVYDDYRILSEKDIIAMKLNAISISGQRSKDFIDLFFALERYSIAEMVSFYQKKYGQQGDMHVLKSLVYFDDVDLSDWPMLIRLPNLKWDNVKAKIEEKVLEYSKSINP
jgi:predicted nucleotidyltransferase component of viral defense system